MIVKNFMTVELFYDCGKTFFIETVLKQRRYVVFDSAIIKLPILNCQYSQDSIA